MANDVRKWAPLVLVAVAVGATSLALRDLPPSVTIDLRGVLPFALEARPDTAPKWVAIFGIPLMAAVVWVLFGLGRTEAGLGMARRLFPDAPNALSDPATVERFRATYDVIALWVVVLILGVHAGVVASALGLDSLAPRIISVTMGLSLMAAGNVMPRLRPNLIAGVRTRATLNDPDRWRATHRFLGLGFVIAGAITIAVGVAAPSYGLMTAVGTLLIASALATMAGMRVASASSRS